MAISAAVFPLVEPYNGLTGSYGISSEGWLPTPFKVDLTALDAPSVIWRFVEEEGLPEIDRWTPAALAAFAEESVGDGDIDMMSAPGWRVVNGAGSPVEPAREAIALCTALLYHDGVAWYEALIAAWEAGSRAAAFTYLEEQRRATLSKLKIEV